MTYLHLKKENFQNSQVVTQSATRVPVSWLFSIGSRQAYSAELLGYPPLHFGTYVGL